LYGEGAYLPLVPFRSIAVNPKKIAYGTVLYIPDAVGAKVTLPDGSTAIHDGYFIAADENYYGDTTISIYFGPMDYHQYNPFSNFATIKLSGDFRSFKAYIVTDNAIKNGLINLSKSFKNKQLYL